MISIEDMNNEAVKRKAQEILDAAAAYKRVQKAEAVRLEGNDESAMTEGGHRAWDTNPNTIEMRFLTGPLTQEFGKVFWEGVPPAQPTPEKEAEQIEKVLVRLKREILTRIKANQGTPGRVRNWLTDQRIEQMIDRNDPRHLDTLRDSRNYLNYYSDRDDCQTLGYMAAWRSFDNGFEMSGPYTRLFASSPDRPEGLYVHGFTPKDFHNFRKFLAYYYLAAIDRTHTDPELDKENNKKEKRSLEDKQRITIASRVSRLLDGLSEISRAHNELERYGRDAFLGPDNPSCPPGHYSRIMLTGLEHPVTAPMAGDALLQNNVSNILDMAVTTVCKTLSDEDREALYQALTRLNVTSAADLLRPVPSRPCSPNALRLFNELILNIPVALGEARAKSVEEVVDFIAGQVIRGKIAALRGDVQGHALTLTDRERALIKKEVLDVGSSRAELISRKLTDAVNIKNAYGPTFDVNDVLAYIFASGQKKDMVKTLKKMSTKREQVEGIARYIVKEKLFPTWTDSNVHALKSEIATGLAEMKQAEEKERKESEEVRVGTGPVSPQKEEREQGQQKIEYERKVAHEGRGISLGRTTYGVQLGSIEAEQRQQAQLEAEWAQQMAQTRQNQGPRGAAAAPPAPAQPQGAIRSPYLEPIPSPQAQDGAAIRPADQPLHEQLLPDPQEAFDERVRVLAADLQISEEVARKLMHEQIEAEGLRQRRQEEDAADAIRQRVKQQATAEPQRQQAPTPAQGALLLDPLQAAMEAQLRARREVERADREEAARLQRQYDEEDRQQRATAQQQQRIEGARAAALEQQRREAEARERQRQVQPLERERSVEREEVSYEQYFEENPDVKKACQETDALRREWFALRHYNEHGRSEGRIYPRREVYFCYERYFEENPDVRKACGATTPLERRQFALQHYNEHGRREGRPYPGRYFSDERYFEEYPDVRNACRATDPLKRREFAVWHYMEHGRREGRDYPIQQAPRIAP